MDFFQTYGPIETALSVASALFVVFGSFGLMWIWRHRRHLAMDFFGMGSSYLGLTVCSIFWVVSLSQTYFFLVSIWSIFWVAAYSYATLRIIHPAEKRTVAWSLLLYLSVIPVWLISRSLMFATFHILLLSALVTFVSSFVLFQLCKNTMKKYAVAGMIAGVMSASYIPLLGNISGLSMLFMAASSGFFIFLPVNLLLAYVVFGFLRTPLKRPHEFLCDYDGKRRK